MHGKLRFQTQGLFCRKISYGHGWRQLVVSLIHEIGQKAFSIELIFGEFLTSQFLKRCLLHAASKNPIHSRALTLSSKFHVVAVQNRGTPNESTPLLSAAHKAATKGSMHLFLLAKRLKVIMNQLFTGTDHRAAHWPLLFFQGYSWSPQNSSLRMSEEIFAK